MVACWNALVAMVQNDSTLTVAEDTPPEISNIQVSTTELTNQDVVVTADFSGTTELYFTGYRIGEGTEWFEYVDGVTVSENAVVYFMAEDAIGNRTEIAGCTVTNIDKTAPEKPVASEDVTAYTNGDVFVTAIFSEDSAIREYSLDGETWTGYTEAVRVSENRTVYFRGADESDVAKYRSIYDKLQQVYTPRFNTTIRFAGDAAIGFKFKPFTANDLIDYELFIYDRGGTLVFHTNDIEASWDGTYRGYECKPGAYVYIANYRRKGVERLMSQNGTGTIIK